MLYSAYNIPINKNQEETIQRGIDGFPCSAYQGDLHQFFPGYLPTHWHNELEFFVLDSGKVKIATEKETFELKEGDGYFVNSGSLHGIYPLCQEPCCFHSLVFDPIILYGATGSVYDLKYIRPFLEDGADIYPIYNEIGEMQKLIRKFNEAFHSCVEENELYEICARTILTEIVIFFMNSKNSIEPTRESVQVKRAKGMVHWIESHYAQSIKVKEIADSQNICIRECQRIFNEILHISPMRYVIEYRISQSLYLLKNTNQSIMEIANSCGFDSSSYFSKCFKEILGMTPKEYRIL